MKRVLIVDDDTFKRDNIVSLLSKMSGEYNVVAEKALNPGLRRLLSETFDIILLDMSLPVFDLSETDNFESFGGLTFLREMKRKRIKTPTIIITQYEIFGEGSAQYTSESINDMCKSEFSNYVDLIVYSSLNNAWKEKLVKTLGVI